MNLRRFDRKNCILSPTSRGKGGQGVTGNVGFGVKMRRTRIEHMSSAYHPIAAI
jgi:hypothetical protein